MKRRLIWVTMAGLAGALALLTGVTYIILSARVQSDVETTLRARADAAAVGVTMQKGRVQFDDANGQDLFDTGTWVFDTHGRLLETPTGGSSLTAEARSFGNVPREHVSEVREGVMMLARPVVRQGEPVATVVVAVSVAEYNSVLTTGLWAVVGLDLALLVLAALFVRKVVSAALKPVADMTERAEQWSVHDLDRRFHLGDGQDEISRLGTTFDQLLGRLATSLSAEQRLTSEIAHELRTPLARISTDLDVTCRRDRDSDEFRQALRRTQREVVGLAEVVDQLLASAESRSLDRSLRTPVAAAVGRVIREVSNGDGIDIEVCGDTSVCAVCDAGVLARLLAPIVSNALTYAQSHVVVAIEAHDGVTIRIDDDGPGLAAGEEYDVFEPGRRGSGALPGGSGLGLSLSRRLARSIGGEVTAEATTKGGRFTVVIPAAPADDN